MNQKAKQLRESLLHWPRWMTNDELCAYFGLSERALVRLTAVRGFPQKDVLIHKTDSKAVDLFFDRMSGLDDNHPMGNNDEARARERLS